VVNRRAIEAGIAATVTAVGLAGLYLVWPSSPDKPTDNVGAVATATPSPVPTGISATTEAPKKSRWPDDSNTGYRNAPDYPGELKRFSGRIKSGATYKFLDFPHGVEIGKGVRDVTFIGCRFASNNVVDTTVALYGDDITFRYSTFEPAGMTGKAKTVDYERGYQYAIDQRAPGSFTVENSDFWGWGNGIQFAWSTKSNPVVVRDSWFHHARTDGDGVDHTDAILENYGGPSHMVFDHNTIVSVGNTNGLALQGPGYENVTVTNNYFSGFGYTVSLGVKPEQNRNFVFKDNTFGTDIKPGWGPVYGWRDGPGNVWEGNKWRVAPGGYSRDKSDDGKYWLPDGGPSSRDYSG
jgi:hypothetical protein